MSEEQVVTVGVDTHTDVHYGLTVIEVDRPDRTAHRRNGKSDPLDAESAARAVQSGRAGRSVRYVQIMRQVLSAALSRAVREELIGRNVARLAELPSLGTRSC
jgi:hypothetical protein